MKKLIVITAPSGAGKTTIVRHLLNKYDCLDFSVSATNRKPREKEKDGIDYYFLSTRRFIRKIKNGNFIEWQEVYNNQFYGTLKSEVDRIWELNKSIIFDIEVKGAENIKEQFPETLTIFIKPPSPEVLFERLRNRKTESKKSLEKRIERATMELKKEKNFDIVLVNDNLETALKEAEKIVEDFLELKTN